MMNFALRFGFNILVANKCEQTCLVRLAIGNWLLGPMTLFFIFATLKSYSLLALKA
ncbi:unnamed protein product [Prunus brigantina]